MGNLEESKWIYEANKDSSRSAIKYPGAKYAKPRKLLEYTRLTGGVDTICQALAARIPVSIGAPWYKEWMKTSSNGNMKIPKITSSVAGGHEVCLHGYSIQKQVFLLVNSWGEKKWGNMTPGWYGTGWLPFKAVDIFKYHGGYDAYTANILFPQKTKNMQLTGVV